ncbi:MAG TPA: TetR family transcriptional regulator [Ktedonobacteraceae bacterium]
MPAQRVSHEREGGKARLLKAAQGLVQERSFDDVTVEEIIKRARLSRPAFYYHFAGGKEELRAALVERGVLPERPIQDARELLLNAALRVYARSGVSAATLDDIASEAGVTKSALCWHFHSKEDLLSELIKHYSPHSYLAPVIDQFKRDMQAGMALNDEMILRRLAGAFYDAFNHQGDHARLAFLLIYTHPEVAELLTERIITGRKSINDYVSKRQEDGYFRSEIDPAFFVQFMAVTFAMRAVARGLYVRGLSGELPRDALIEQVVSLLLYGIVRRDMPEKGQE